MLNQNKRQLILADMVDTGELIKRGDDIYEDMGGHLSHASTLDYAIDAYLKSKPKAELKALLNRMEDL